MTGGEVGVASLIGVVVEETGVAFALDAGAAVGEDETLPVGGGAGTVIVVVVARAPSVVVVVVVVTPKADRVMTCDLIRN